MLNTSIKLNLNNKLFLKDPEETELGRKILFEGIRLIDELGFEVFTFRKLASVIESTEASAYRYFENKHRLLIYLISWYWVWLDYKIKINTKNIKNPKERLKIILHIISESQQDDPNTYIDEAALYRIVINESSKTYLTKDVDKANQEGFYIEYKNLCKNIAKVINEVSPRYPYAHSLVSMLIETSHTQTFFAQHLPSLSDIKINNQNYRPLQKYLEHILFSALNNG